MRTLTCQCKTAAKLSTHAMYSVSVLAGFQRVQVIPPFRQETVDDQPKPRRYQCTTRLALFCTRSKQTNVHHLRQIIMLQTPS